MKKENKDIEIINEEDYEIEAYVYCDNQEQMCKGDCYLGFGAMVTDVS